MKTCNKKMKVKQRFNKKGSSSRNLIIKSEGTKWHEIEDVSAAKVSHTSVNENIVFQLKNEGDTLHKQDIASYKKFSENRKDFAWIHTVLKSGTLSDKISAHILLIQDSPVHNLDKIVNLVSMVNTKGKRECLMSMDTLRDLFLSDLLPENRKLKTFDQYPLKELEKLNAGNSDLRNRKLVLWYFEDKLKSVFANFVRNLESVSHDTVEKTKQKAVSVMAELLKCVPEQEQFLLEHLVNKIGDPAQKVGAHVCHLLGQILDCHPNMKGTILQEIERLLFRANVPDRTKYYCLCVLNQMILFRDDKSIANHLIKIYFGLFKVCVKKGEVNNKIMSALLTGVTRAHPYSAFEDSDASEQLNAMYRIVHMVSFNISVQALMLIFQVLNSKDSISERFYSALYRKLLDPEVSTSSRQSVLLNLIHRALKKDASSRRVKAFVKRLIQISLYQAPHLQCGLLYLISDLSKTHPNLLDVVKTSALDYGSDDEDEHFEDVIEEEDDSQQSSQNAVIEKMSKLDPAAASNVPSSWVHKQNQGSATKSKSSYDPYCRNPLYAGAEYCTLWEMRFLRNCFHPSVSLFAQQVSTNHEIKYSGDPLQDFTLARFLDRFVYRNPKKSLQNESSDLHRKVFGARKLYVPSGSRQLQITSEKYLQQKEADVPVEESFIFKFLQKQVQSGKMKKGDEDSDIESVNSEEFEEILDKYNAEDEGKDALNFVKELSDHKSKKSKKSRVDVSDDEDLGSFEDDSDIEDPNFESDEDFQDAFEEFDDDLKEADEMKSAFEHEDFDSEISLGRTSKPVKKKKKKERFDGENLFASADQFATLLEDNAKMDSTTAESFINKDKSDAKQILWERKRDQYVRGVDWKSKKSKKFKKRPNKFQKTGKKFNKNKK